MTKKKLIIASIFLGVLFFIYMMAGFAPGSYANAEQYELDYPEKKVIEAINKLKEIDKDLVVPKVSIQNSGQNDLSDGKESESEYWYNFYFYNKEKKQIIFTWTRPSGHNSTTFAFVAINNGLDLGNWKTVNNDFGFFENRKIKKNFEETILKRIKIQLDSN